MMEKLLQTGLPHKNPGKIIFTLLLFILLSIGLQAKEINTSLEEKITNKKMIKKVTGTISSSKNNSPINGASVVVKGTSRGTTTNNDGHFEIEVNDGEVLVISAIGYSQQEITIAPNANYIIQLEEVNKELGEVVVTALGVSKQKRQLGFSVTEVKGTELAKTNEINPINSLQGRVAGVQIDQGAGGLFGNTKIVIRGNSTLGTNNQPIFVVDGVIMDNGTFNGRGRDFGNDFKNLNPDDFETVSVLKGSAAAALYGVRAVNGVILITTKKGKAKKGIGVTFSESVTVSNPYAGPDFQNEFGGGTVGAFFTDSRDPNYKSNEAWTTKVFPIDPITGKPYIDRQIGRELENWGPRMLGQEVINYDGTVTRYSAQPNNFLDAFQNGLGSNTNLALDGGTDKSTIRVSYNHNQAEGIVSNNKYGKDAFDVRATHKLTRFLSVDAGVAYSNFRGQNPPRLGGLDAFASDNFGKLFSWVLPRNYDTKYWMQPQHYISQFGGVPDFSNPNETNRVTEARFWYMLYQNKYLQNEDLIRGRLSVTADITPWAKVVLEGNVNNVYLKRENKEPGQLRDFKGGSYGTGSETRKSKFLKALIFVNKPINKNIDFSGFIGVETQKFDNNYSYSETRGGLIYPGNFTIKNSVNQPVTTDTIRRKSLRSVYASVDFSYKNMLFWQSTFRNDWSSTLAYSDGSGNSSFSYPATSLSWIFTETFKGLPSWISYGKLRANIAFLGGDTEPYVLNPGFAFIDYVYPNGQSGGLPTSTYSSGSTLQQNIKPSQKLSKEIGAEVRFLKNRIGFDISYYRDNTKNQIIPIQVPIVSGVNSLLVNAGNIQNSGIEISIEGTPIKGKNFTWNTNLTYSRNRNKIVELYPGIKELNLNANIGEISTWAVEGKSYGVLRSAIHAKKFQAKDGSGNNVDDPRNGLPILSWRTDAYAAFPARSNVIKDVGDINAKFRAGWDNTFSYKNLSLNVLIDAKIGGDFVLLSYRYGTHTGVFPNTLQGRDKDHGGIEWTAFDGTKYDDGVIPEGVFAEGQTISYPGKPTVNVGGMTFKQAYEKGFVEPTHLPQFGYRYGSSSTGVSDYWILKNSWVALRQVALTYSFNPKLYEKLKLNALSFSIVGRDLGYLYQSLPYNFNPASNNSNNTAFSGEEGFLPKTRNIVFTLRAQF